MSGFNPIPLSDKKPRWRIWLLIGIPLLVLVLYVAYRLLAPGPSTGRWAYYRSLLLDRDSVSEFILQPGMRCGDSVFAIPSAGTALGLWDQSYRIGHRHSGIDLFPGTEPGVTPVYAAYSGYLTRLAEWRSTLIIRIPADPLQPGRQIWTYYTHMATKDGQSFISEQFPEGSFEVFIEEGTLLGYQGDYSGDPLNPTGLHLHFSIVRDDGAGSFLNELDITNTIDPSPYFNLAFNHNTNPDEIPICEEEITYADWDYVDSGG